MDMKHCGDRCKTYGSFIRIETVQQKIDEMSKQTYGIGLQLSLNVSPSAFLPLGKVTIRQKYCKSEFESYILQGQTYMYVLKVLKPINTTACLSKTEFRDKPIEMNQGT